MRIDHVIYGTGDLGAAAAWFADEFELPAAPGGRHDGLGTCNQLVPLGDGSFIELLAIANYDEAMCSPLGGALCSAVECGDGLLGWAVGVDDIDTSTRRLGTSISVVGRDGLLGRPTGVEEALAEPFLPFFIERSADWRRRSEVHGRAGLCRGLMASTPRSPSTPGPRPPVRRATLWRNSNSRSTRSCRDRAPIRLATTSGDA